MNIAMTLYKKCYHPFHNIVEALASLHDNIARMVFETVAISPNNEGLS